MSTAADVPLPRHRYPEQGDDLTLHPLPQAFLREWFAVISRNLNTASAFLLSLLSGRSYRRTAARHAVAKQQAWHRWWRSARGTFNALIEQEGLAGAGDNGSGANGSSLGPGASSGTFLESPQLSGRVPLRRASISRRDSSSSVGSSSGSGRVRGWRFWRRRNGSGHGADEVPSTPSGQPDLRRGTVLFELPSGFAVVQVGSQEQFVFMGTCDVCYLVNSGLCSWCSVPCCLIYAAAVLAAY